MSKEQITEILKQNREILEMNKKVLEEITRERIVITSNPKSGIDWVSQMYTSDSDI